MSVPAIFASFLLYSVFGWVLDTAWRSLRAGRYARGGFSRHPFSPIYGFGALIALGLAPLLYPQPLWLQWLGLSLLLGAFEFLSGVLIVKTLHHRLWNYTDEPFDLRGHTTPFYALVWGGLALLVIYVTQPALETACLLSRFCTRLFL